MPTLYILAGPNGAGKSTFYFTAIEQGFIDKEWPFINTDIIAKNELGATQKKISKKQRPLYEAGWQSVFQKMKIF